MGILATPEKNQKFHSELIESVGQPLYVKCKKCAGLRFNLRNQPCPACDGEGVIRNGRAWDMQWIGRVFGVADDCAWSGLNFGDVVQLSRMAECQWFFRPVGFEGWTGTYYMESDDGSVRLEAHGSEAWVFLKPEQIPVVLMQRKHGVDYVSCVPGIVAGPHRLLVRLFNDNELSDSEIINPHMGGVGQRSVGEIVSVGADVDDVDKGQICGIDPLAGIRFRPTHDEHYWVSIHQDHVHFVFDKDDFPGLQGIAYTPRHVARTPAHAENPIDMQKNAMLELQERQNFQRKLY